MVVYGFDSIAPMLKQDGYLFKVIVNDSGVVFFPQTTEHATRLNRESNTLMTRLAMPLPQW